MVKMIKIYHITLRTIRNKYTGEPKPLGETQEQSFHTLDTLSILIQGISL